MKEKTITLKVNGAAQGQWSHLLLELNLMKKAWKSYGVNINMKASGLRNVINHGTKVHDDTRKVRRVSK
jgi:prophage tail gpP-like protein